MNTQKTIVAGLWAAFLFIACHVQKSEPLPVAITWEMGKNEVEPGYFESTFYIKNTGKTPLSNNWTIYYNQSPVTPRNQEEAPLQVERIMSTYFKIFPTKAYQTIAPGETLSFTFRSRGSLIKESAAPRGAYIVCRDENGKECQPQNIPIETLPFTQAYQWTRPSAREIPYPDGNYMYEQNALFSQAVQLDETAIFPSLKSTVKTGGNSLFSKTVKIESDPAFENEAGVLKEKLSSLFGCTISEAGETLVRLKKSNEEWKPEYYELTIRNNQFELVAGDADAVFNACQTLLNMLGNTGKLPASIADMQIADFPDTHHRGLMLDVSRNFTSKENILKLIDLLSMYKINVLHLHLTDDEAWRIEIPGLDELTQIASRRGHTTDESTCLYPAFGWGWDASDKQSLANGYYSRNEFIEILKFANKRHVKIIPEVDIPGHSRAAIKAMNARYNQYRINDKLKAEEYLLTDFADTSRYLSAQSFTDNVINVAMPSAYRFVEKVIDEIDRMYADAGLKMSIFHIGGDEVPHGAWENSTVCRDFMKERGMTQIRELKDYFLEQVLPMLARRNIQPAGWEEVALLPNHLPNERFRNSSILSYCWNTVSEWKGDEMPYQLANAGYPIILCNVTNLYMDMAYSKHPCEPGLHWGGFVNEYNSFDMLPYTIYKSVRHDLSGKKVDSNEVVKTKLPLSENARGQIIGLQAQLWAETIRDFDQIEYYLFPKLFGLIERAWNIQPAWSLASDDSAYEEAKRLYNAQIAEKELPRLAKMRVHFRISQPGVIVKDRQLYANTAIPGAVIRYTIDGNEPTEQSPAWTLPTDCNAALVKAKAFYLGKESVTTVLKNE